MVKPIFPQILVLDSTSDASKLFKQLMNDTNVDVRTQCILQAAQHGRDDFLPQIRALSTHLGMQEQEVCALALGLLKDGKSIPRLCQLAESKNENVQLAAEISLVNLGMQSRQSRIMALAETRNLFAISALGNFSRKRASFRTTGPR